MPDLKLLEQIFDVNSKNDQIKVLFFSNYLTLSHITKVISKPILIKIKFNQIKCIKWLANKVRAVESYLVKSQPEQANNSEKLGLEAFELICQYLDRDLCGPLRKEMGLGSPLDTNDSNKIKRAKQEIKTEIKAE